MKRQHCAASVFLVATLAVTACGTDGSDPTDPGSDPDDPSDVAPPTMAEVAGDYEATEFTGGGYDVLDEGGSLDMTLGDDGSLSGSMHVPPGAGGPFDADMVGTYTIDSVTLTFNQSADTFVRDATWEWLGDGVIEGEWSGSSASASVRLER